MNFRQKFRVVGTFVYNFTKIGPIGIIPAAFFSALVRWQLGPDYEQLTATYVGSVVGGILIFGISGGFLAAHDYISELDEGERRRKALQKELAEATNFCKNIRNPEIARFVEKPWEKLGKGYEDSASILRN